MLSLPGFAFAAAAKACAVASPERGWVNRPCGPEIASDTVEKDG